MNIPHKLKKEPKKELFRFSEVPINTTFLWADSLYIKIVPVVDKQDERMIFTAMNLTTMTHSTFTTLDELEIVEISCIEVVKV